MPARSARAKRSGLARTTDLADRLHSAAIHLLRRLRREDDASGLPAPQLSALSVIVFGGPITLGALADRGAGASADDHEAGGRARGGRARRARGRQRRSARRSRAIDGARRASAPGGAPAPRRDVGRLAGESVCCRSRVARARGFGVGEGGSWLKVSSRACCHPERSEGSRLLRE